MNKIKREPTLFLAFIPIIFLITFLVLNVKYFGDGTLDGSNQVVLLLASAIAGIIAYRLGSNWEYILDRIVNSISSAMPSILILLLIGALAGTWMISGVVPAMIYYGLKLFHPSIFLFATVVITGIVSLATGSSWSTVATMGIALIGIGQALGINEGVIAGAVISGAYFGDKMSPLSDTTNLAPAMAGTDLFTHIRYMTITTVPSILLTLIIFLVIGFTYNFDGSAADVSSVLTAIDTRFNINLWLFLVPAGLITIIILKVPPLPAILIGSLLGGAFAVIFQPHLLYEIAGSESGFFKVAYVSVMKAIFGDVSITTSNAMVNELLSTSGMTGMLNTIWLILSAMIFGGSMESAGLLVKISSSVINYAKSTGSLVATTIATSIFFNITASDQYIAIVVPGRMYADTYRKRGLKPEVLSRTLEDGGTLTSVLVPWNTCGATQSRVLGVSTFSYLPFAFFNIINPIVSILMASFNYKIRKFKEGEEIIPENSTIPEK
ncbi:MAG: Na+/H+ antiporter NhaC [Bacteroidales bacterium]|nr:Na+/H+ antiporter NhaC [Bacteroidales bacterium]MCF8391335.1 Na+/H+ antiporter NhaC [Bacteroidales bacterium]